MSTIHKPIERYISIHVFLCYVSVCTYGILKSLEMISIYKSTMCFYFQLSTNTQLSFGIPVPREYLFVRILAELNLCCFHALQRLSITHTSICEKNSTDAWARSKISYLRSI